MINLNLDKKHKYLLACSFGPDSMALFHLLVKNEYKFDCAIVNYHLRNESNSEVDNLLKYASKFNIKVHVLDVKEKINKNIEATCRELRYKFFRDLCKKFNYDATLVAHHQDDLIETYLMQKDRQNCPIFYGISENTVIYGTKIIRPLLNYTKQELIQLCNQNDVPYSIDKTNYDISILRNKIRHNIIDKLTVDERNKIVEEINVKNEKLSKILSSIDINRLSSVSYILSLNFITQCYALNMYIKSIDDSLSLSKKNVGQIINILKSNKPNGQFTVYKGLYLFKEYEIYEFGVNKLETPEYQYILNSPSILDTPYFYLNFNLDAKDRNVHLDDYPLIIRNIRKSDFIIINGYKAKAQRLLIDWKVPFRKRLTWPVIINKNGECIYIPRYRKDFKISENINFYVK